MKLAIRVTYFPAIQIDIDYHFRPLMMCRHRYRINGRRLGMARPFPLWRLHSGPQSSSVDQYSETPPEHLVSNLADAVGISAVTRNLLKNNLGGEMKRARCDHHNNFAGSRTEIFGAQHRQMRIGDSIAARPANRPAP
jgi:hypothetical protein